MQWHADQREASMMKISFCSTSRKRGVPSELLPVPDTQQLAIDLENLVKKSPDIFQHQTKGGAIMYLRHAQVLKKPQGKYLSMLIAYSDTRHPDGVISNLKNKKRVIASKNKDDGDEYSCHLVISMTPILDGGRMFYMAYEQIPRFGGIQLERYLKRIFRTVVNNEQNNYHFPDPEDTSSTGKTVRYSVKVELSAVPSDQLIKDLENGEIGRIELIREAPGSKKWDEKGFTTDKRSILILQPTEKAYKTNVMSFIEEICKSGARKKYDTATLRWKHERKGYTAKFDCSSENILSTRYIKKAEFNFDYRLPASSDKIDPGFESRLIKWIG